MSRNNDCNADKEIFWAHIDIYYYSVCLQLACLNISSITEDSPWLVALISMVLFMISVYFAQYG